VNLNIPRAANFEVAIGTTTDKSRVWPVMAMTRMTRSEHSVRRQDYVNVAALCSLISGANKTRCDLSHFN
jgi:hypothetical protein